MGAPVLESMFKISSTLDYIRFPRSRIEPPPRATNLSPLPEMSAPFLFIAIGREREETRNFQGIMDYWNNDHI